MLFRKMLRTIGRYKSQFISMIIMIALGVSMFLGFNMEWVSLERDTNAFFEATGFADYRITSKDGFTQEEAEKIAAIDGVDAAGRYLSVNADVQGTKNSLGVTVTTNPAVSGFVVTEGAEYDASSADGIWLFDKYAENNDVHIGDTLTITYESMTFSGSVKGLIESGEYMICLRDETQLMPDFKTYGYAYVTPVMLQTAIRGAAEQDTMDNLGSLIPSEFSQPLAHELTTDTADELFESIYPQINVRTALSKAEFTKAVDDALERTLLILTKDENVSYAESHGEIEEGQTMGSLLPILFLLIAVLTMVSTMHRLAVNEKTQIGTLKALGYRDWRILWHYTTFALAIGVFGSAVGVALGYLIAALIMNPNGMMGTYIIMTDWTIYLPWWGWMTVGLIVAFLTLIGFLSTKKMLAGTAADALRPYTPKKMKRALIEKLPLLDRLSFGTKWNLRDILRHKSRSLMTLFGVVGCTVLVTAALGMNDTMMDFMSTYYNDIAVYESKIFLSDDAKSKDALRIAEEYDGDACASVSVQIEDKPISLDIYHIRSHAFNFLDENNNKMQLPKDGALVCMRLRDEYDLHIGDSVTVSPYGTSDEYTLRVAGINRSLTESISLSDEYAATLTGKSGALTGTEQYKIGTVYTREQKDNISDSAISTVQSKRDIMDSMDSFMEIFYLFVVILIVAAVALGVIVLYNLGVMSFTERYREMATLKVVGFRDRKIGSLLISQNIWLSVLGVAIGVPTGYWVLATLMKLLAAEYEMKAMLSLPSILISMALTLGVSLAVGLIIARKNKKIEMVSALKTPE